MEYRTREGVKVRRIYPEAARKQYMKTLRRYAKPDMIAKFEKMSLPEWCRVTGAFVVVE